MVKKFCLLGIFSSVLHIQAMDVMEYIPRKSEIRQYCLQNKTTNETQKLCTYLEKMSKSKSLLIEIKAYDEVTKKLENEKNQLNRYFSVLENEGVTNQKEFIRNLKTKTEQDIIDLKNKKKLVEKDYLPFNFLIKGKQEEITNFNTMVEGILKNVDESKHDQERNYIKEALINAYEHKIPGQTFNESFLPYACMVFLEALEAACLGKVH